MDNLSNKIEAKDKSLWSIFSENRYRIDVFQREYRWQPKQVESLLCDLTNAFMSSWSQGHNLENVEQYNTYYMGPIVLCKEGSEYSIVDGQQRLTSFSLLFVYLQHLQDRCNIPHEQKRDLREQLYIKRGGKYTFKINVKERNEMMELLLDSSNNSYDLAQNIKEGANSETLENLVGRYEDMNRYFPQELKDPDVLPLFIEWLLYHVIFVEVVAFSIDNAYTIFETMNDRGLSLNPTEILKAFILSKISDDERSIEINDYWKDKIATIKYKTGSDGDLAFFRSWFRAKYAVTVRTKNSSIGKEDFEEIGSQFHSWFKNNIKNIGIKTPMEYYYFVKSDMDFYANAYVDIMTYSYREVQGNYMPLFVTNSYPMADSLYLPLMMSPLNVVDSTDTVLSKILIVNQFVDKYINRRSIAIKSINQGSIRNYIYELTKKLRSLPLADVQYTLSHSLSKMGSEEYSLSSTQGYSMAYMHYFYARILFHLKPVSSFVSLLRSKRQSSYIIHQIFTNEEFETLNLGRDGFNAWSICNYCLIRRNEQQNIPLRIEDRIQWLINKGYMPELSESNIHYPEQFLAIRFSRLKEVVDDIWTPEIV